jgi:hypothetical protein
VETRVAAEHPIMHRTLLVVTVSIGQILTSPGLNDYLSYSNGLPKKGRFTCVHRKSSFYELHGC